MNDHDDACALADDAMLAEVGAGAGAGAEADAEAHNAPTLAHDNQAARNDVCEPAVSLAARLAAHHRVRRTLFGWMHPARLAELPYAKRLSELDSARAAALAEAFLAGAGFKVPALPHFRPADAALALLPPAAVLAVFRLRALLDHVVQLQGWIDRPRRAWLAGWVGADGARLLLTRRRELGGESSLAARFVRAPAVDEQAGDALAWRGLRLFARECGWQADAPLAMLQLALPAAAAALPLAQCVPFPAQRGQDLGGAGREAVRAPSLAIMAQLPALFPGVAW